MGTVDEKLCYEKHVTIKSTQERIINELDAHEKRLDSIEEELIRLNSTIVIITKKNIFDKILIAALAGMVLLFMILLIGAANVIKLIGLIGI